MTDEVVPRRRLKVAQVMPWSWVSCAQCGMSVQHKMLAWTPAGNMCPDCYGEEEWGPDSAQQALERGPR